MLKNVKEAKISNVDNKDFLRNKNEKANGSITYKVKEDFKICNLRNYIDVVVVIVVIKEIFLGI